MGFAIRFSEANSRHRLQQQPHQHQHYDRNTRIVRLSCCPPEFVGQGDIAVARQGDRVLPSTDGQSPPLDRAPVIDGSCQAYPADTMFCSCYLYKHCCYQYPYRYNPTGILLVYFACTSGRGRGPGPGPSPSPGLFRPLEHVHPCSVVVATHPRTTKLTVPGPPREIEYFRTHHCLPWRARTIGSTIGFAECTYNTAAGDDGGKHCQGSVMAPLEQQLTLLNMF